MNNSEKKQSSIIPVMGMLALIVVLFIGIKLVFAGMEAVLPQKQQSGSQSTAQSSQMLPPSAPSAGRHFMRGSSGASTAHTAGIRSKDKEE